MTDGKQLTKEEIRAILAEPYDPNWRTKIAQEIYERTGCISPLAVQAFEEKRRKDAERSE